MTLFLTLVLLLGAALPAVAQSNLRSLIEAQSQSSLEVREWMNRASSFSPAAFRALARRSAFDAALEDGLVRRSEPGPDRERRLQVDSDFSPDAMRRLGKRSELSAEAMRRLNRESHPPEGWISPEQMVSSLLNAYLSRRSRIGSGERARLERFLSERGFGPVLRRGSAPTPSEQDLIRRRSMASDTERRIIRRLSVD